MSAITRRLCSLLPLAALCLASGCIAVGSSTKKSGPPTLGQELVDLKAAHDQGAVSDEEYGQTRRTLLKECGNR